MLKKKTEKETKISDKNFLIKKNAETEKHDQLFYCYPFNKFSTLFGSKAEPLILHSEIRPKKKKKKNKALRQICCKHILMLQLV